MKASIAAVVAVGRAVWTSSAVNLQSAMRGCVILLAFLALNAFATSPEDSHPFLHPLFSDHLVLQREARVPIWGWSEPGAKVVVGFGPQTAVAVTGADGRWMARLKPMSASVQPRILTVTNLSTHEFVVVSDVLVGDVWLCSGQSNMEMGVEVCNMPGEIASANFPQIRLMTVPRLVSLRPVQTMSCSWLPCSPETLKKGVWGGFSAAGFFFGRDLHRELKIPIGLIHSSWGGTIAEAWTSDGGLAPLGDFNQAIEMVHAQAEGKGAADYDQMYQAWCLNKDAGSKAGWDKGAGDESAWKSVQMPQSFRQSGLGEFHGMVWYRREFDLSESWRGKELSLHLGTIDDFDTTWVNGVKVGQMNVFYAPRHYQIPANILHPGRNVITVRVLDTGGEGGLTGHAEDMWIVPVGEAQSGSVALSGSWQMRVSTPLSELSSPPILIGSDSPNVSTVLFNGMIAPLLPFAIKGAIWYQGESNADRAHQYQHLLPAMIEDWRRHFGVGAFPFYIVQLAAFQKGGAEPRDNAWAELREAQAMTAAKVPNCGLAVAIDIGDAADIHPKDKLSVGHRLACIALEKTYGRKTRGFGPWYRSMNVSEGWIRVKFDHAEGLMSRGGKLTGFAIAGEDRKFFWADAMIEGDTIVVSSRSVSKPVAVRYAWDNNPTCNLYNKAGLPAVPFRTDSWTAITDFSK